MWCEFRKLGYIEYNGKMQIRNSLLNFSVGRVPSAHRTSEATQGPECVAPCSSLYTRVQYAALRLPLQRLSPTLSTSILIFTDTSVTTAGRSNLWLCVARGGPRCCSKPDCVRHESPPRAQTSPQPSHALSGFAVCLPALGAPNADNACRMPQSDCEARLPPGVIQRHVEVFERCLPCHQ